MAHSVDYQGLRLWSLSYLVIALLSHSLVIELLGY